MKKITLIITMILVLLISNATAVFADAVAFDVETADYYVYVATPDGGLNMRHGPGVEYGKVIENRIPDGVRLYITAVSGNWGLTTYAGETGWVALKQTTTKPPAPPSTPKPVVTSTPTTAEPTAKPQTTTPMNEPTPQSTKPVMSEEPMQSTETASEGSMQISDGDTIVVKKAVLHQIILVLALLLLVVIMSIIAVIVINSKSKK